MDLNPGGLIGAAIVLVAVLILERRSILRFFRRRMDAPRRRRESKELIRAAAGGRPPMAPSDTDALRAWLAANALPYVALTIGPEPAASPYTSHIGGAPLLPPGMDWPRDRHDNPMVFLLQLNFAELPALSGFPDRGLLLFFIASDDYFGMRASEEGDDIRLVYLQDPAIAAPVLPPLRLAQSPFADPKAEADGRAISFSSVMQMTPWASDWRIDDIWPGWWARGGDPDFAGLVDGADEQPYPANYVGGALRMIEGDPRGEHGWAEYDRVLLRLGSDGPLAWGDLGAACFLIRQADLAALDFTRVRFFWDSN